MPIRKAIGGLLSGPLATVIEGALRDLVEDILDDKSYVRRVELDAVTERVDAFRRELSERRTELYALRQAVEVMQRDLEDDDDLGEAFAEPAEPDALAARLDRATGALDALQGQADAFTATLDALSGRAEQAWQVAHSARVTAEAAVEGVSRIESASPGPG
jgi:hypothetical protein